MNRKKFVPPVKQGPKLDVGLKTRNADVMELTIWADP